MNFSATAAFAWSVADRLRGDYKQSDYGKVILPFTVLRRLFGYSTVTVERPLRDKQGKILRGEKGRQKGKPLPDSSLRDTENVPLKDDIHAYFEREVLPHIPDAWIDPERTKVGYEIPFNRHFYEYVPPRPLEEIDRDLKELSAEIMELLREKRQALISHAVTEGLSRLRHSGESRNPEGAMDPGFHRGDDADSRPSDEGVPMRDSGVEWLGEVPAHWGIAQVRRTLRRIEQGWSPDCLGRPAEGDEWGVMKSGCVNRGRFNDAENKALPHTHDPLPELEIRPGDVLVSRASGPPELVGETAYVESCRPHLMISDKTFRIHCRPHVNPRLVVAVMNTVWFRSQIEAAISGAEGLANSLPQSGLRSFRFTIPHLPEQGEIVAFLKRETELIDVLIEKSRRSIDLLREHRSALISAAVTGKIDVREAA